jgi:hypothetical protein
MYKYVIICAALLTGCADLQVRKIDPVQREHGLDTHVKGFRYYLSRPYVVVKNWVPVSEHVSLLVLKGDDAKQLYGRSVGTIDHRRIEKLDATAATLRPVTDSEWSALKAGIAKGAVTPVAYHRPAASPPVVNTETNITLPATVPAGETAVRDVAGYFDASSSSNDSSRNAATGPGLLPDTNLPTTEDTTKTVNLTGDIDVVFLPDLDEEYAVHNRNFLGQSTYALNFRDGWQLSSVNGEFDSTTVAIEVLNTIDSAVNAAKDIATAGIGGATPAAAKGAAATQAIDERMATDRNLVIAEVVTQTYIKPGFYRVNKPWELEGERGELVGCGLLMKMGIETVTITTVRPALPGQPPKIASPFP